MSANPPRQSVFVEVPVVEPGGTHSTETPLSVALFRHDDMLHRKKHNRLPIPMLLPLPCFNSDESGKRDDFRGALASTSVELGRTSSFQVSSGHIAQAGYVGQRYM
jgi:hypothetical protein